MGFRFERRKQLVPGVRVKASRSGPSLTLGAHSHGQEPQS